MAVSDLLNQNELAVRERKIEELSAEKRIAGVKNWAFAGIGLLLAGFGGFFFNYQNRKKQQALAAELEQNRLRLADFVEIVAAKNREIETMTKPKTRSSHASDLAAETIESKADDGDIETLYRQLVLTENDWLRFKTLFEKLETGVTP